MVPAPTTATPSFRVIITGARPRREAFSMTLENKGVLEVTGPMFDGLYVFKQRAEMLGREPA